MKFVLDILYFPLHLYNCDPPGCLMSKPEKQRALFPRHLDLSAGYLYKVSLFDIRLNMKRPLIIISYSDKMCFFRIFTVNIDLLCRVPPLTDALIVSESGESLLNNIL